MNTSNFETLSTPSSGEQRFDPRENSKTPDQIYDAKTVQARVRRVTSMASLVPPRVRAAHILTQKQEFLAFVPIRDEDQ